MPSTDDLRKTDYSWEACFSGISKKPPYADKKESFMAVKFILSAIERQFQTGVTYQRDYSSISTYIKIELRLGDIYSI